MKFKFPKLHQLVNSDKKASDDDATKYIHVVDGNAIVFNSIVVIVDLREYVKRECKLDDELDLNRLTGIIDWMEGKSFTKEYWSELVKECFANLTGDDCIEIEQSTYNKILIYEEVISDKELSFKLVSDNICREEVAIDRVSINGELISKVTSVFKSELSNDRLVLAFTGQANALKFTFSRREYIYGLISTNYDAATEITAFLGNEEFKENLDKVIPSLSMGEEIIISNENAELLVGRTLYKRAINKWSEDFVDEDTKEVVSVDRNEIIIDKGTILSKQNINSIIEAGIKSVFIYK